MPKYSIITPVNLWTLERVDQFIRCIESVKNINYTDFEWVIVDDGSPLEFLWSQIDGDFHLNVVHKPHQERVLAYNEAFKVAQGDWWTFLDSDDELDPEIFNVLDRIIEENPKYKMINFGSVHKWRDGTIANRDAFRPEKLKVGHEMFGGGNIVNGTFLFNRSVYEKCGGFGDNVDEQGYIKDVDCTSLNYPVHANQEKPYIRDLYLGTPYDFSAAYQLKFPELQELFMEKHPDHPEKLVKELGNPWGQDFALFYQFTRKFHSLPVDEYLYIVNHKL